MAQENIFNQNIEDNTYVDERNLTFQQVQIRAPAATGFQDPPDNALEGMAAPMLNPSMHNDMTTIRNQALLMPSNTRQLRIDQPQPLQENPRVFTNEVDFDTQEVLGKPSAKRLDAKTSAANEKSRGLGIGEKRESQVADLEVGRPTKKRGVVFDSAPRPDINVAARIPGNQLLIANTAFNQMDRRVEPLDRVSDAGKVYLELLDQNYASFMKIRVKHIDEQGRVGIAAWRVINTAPLGGENGQVFVVSEGKQIGWTAGSAAKWTTIMQDGEGDAGGVNIRFRRMLRGSIGGQSYRTKSEEVVKFMKQTYGKLSPQNSYASMR